MLAHLFPQTDDDPFLHPIEVAKRITADFPDSTADWDHANRMLQSELNRLEQAGAPEPVISGHKNLFNNTVYIEVWSSDGSGNGVRFFVYLDSPIEVESIEAHRVEEAVQEKQLVAKIAKCLKYDVEFDM